MNFFQFLERLTGKVLSRLDFFYISGARRVHEWYGIKMHVLKTRLSQPQ